MPHKKSAEKRLRQSEKRRVYNAKIKNELDKSKRILMKKKPATADDWSAFTSLVDKAVQKSVVKKNAGARIKSRLHKKINS